MTSAVLTHLTTEPATGKLWGIDTDGGLHCCDVNNWKHIATPGRVQSFAFGSQGRLVVLIGGELWRHVGFGLVVEKPWQLLASPEAPNG